MKEVIIQKAAEHVLKNGLASESIRTIAQGIGTSHRMINYHFSNSESFWEALINEIRRLEIERTKKYLVTQDAEKRHDIAKAWEYFSTPEYQKIFTLIFEIYVKILRAPDGHEAFVQSFINEWLDLLSANLMKRYQLKSSEARRYARLRLACIRGLMLDLLLTHDEQEITEAVQLLDQLFSVRLSN